MNFACLSFSFPSSRGRQLRRPGQPWTLITCLALLTLVASAPGCAWLRRRPPTGPVVFQSAPTLNELIQTVNSRTSPIRQLQAQGATLAVPGLPPLRTDLVFERPRNFRLRGELPILAAGRQLDLGSNDELFWMWVNDEVFGIRLQNGGRSPIYFSRHDDYQRSPARQILPVEPTWLAEALGLVYLDPNLPHEGPFSLGSDRLAIRTRVASADGDLMRITVVHARYGWVLEQHLIDLRGQTLASTRADRHQYYEEVQVALPHVVKIQLAPGRPEQIAFQLDVNRYLINQLYGDPAQLFALPQIEGHPLVNIADPAFQPPGPNAALDLNTPPNLNLAPAAAPSPGSRFGPNSQPRAADARGLPRSIPSSSPAGAPHAPAGDPYQDYRPRYRGLGQLR